MTGKEDVAAMLAHHLNEAFEQVRKDMERIEFWAGAIAGCSQPVPEYDWQHVNVVVPAKQRAELVSDRGPVGTADKLSEGTA